MSKAPGNTKKNQADAKEPLRSGDKVAVVDTDKNKENDEPPKKLALRFSLSVSGEED